MSDQHDYEFHRKTYDGFINLFKWSTVGVVLLLVLMAVF